MDSNNFNNSTLDAYSFLTSIVEDRDVEDRDVEDRDVEDNSIKERREGWQVETYKHVGLLCRQMIKQEKGENVNIDENLEEIEQILDGYNKLGDEKLHNLQLVLSKLYSLKVEINQLKKQIKLDIKEDETLKNSKKYNNDIMGFITELSQYDQKIEELCKNIFPNLKSSDEMIIWGFLQSKYEIIFEKNKGQEKYDNKVLNLEQKLNKLKKSCKTHNKFKKILSVTSSVANMHYKKEVKEINDYRTALLTNNTPNVIKGIQKFYNESISLAVQKKLCKNEDLQYINYGPEYIECQMKVRKVSDLKEYQEKLLQVLIENQLLKNILYCLDSFEKKYILMVKIERIQRIYNIERIEEGEVSELINHIMKEKVSYDIHNLIQTVNTKGKKQRTDDFVKKHHSNLLKKSMKIADKECDENYMQHMQKIFLDQVVLNKEDRKIIDSLKKGVYDTIDKCIDKFLSEYKPSKVQKMKGIQFKKYKDNWNGLLEAVLSLLNHGEKDADEIQQAFSDIKIKIKNSEDCLPLFQGSFRDNIYRMMIFVFIVSADVNEEKAKELRSKCIRYVEYSDLYKQEKEMLWYHIMPMLQGDIKKNLPTKFIDLYKSVQMIKKKH